MKNTDTEIGECYEFPSRNAAGYGQIQSGGRKNRRHWYAHRVVWEMAHGPVPDGMVVRHRCDNPPCVRLDHLLLGTNADNTRDMMERGRGKQPRFKKEDHPLAKLTQQDVNEIRYVYRHDGASQSQLAALFGVSQSQIGRIVRGESWR
jgi:hypothetical protein